MVFLLEVGAKGGVLIRDFGDWPAAGEKFEVFHQFSVQKSCKNNVFERLGRRRRQKITCGAKNIEKPSKNIIFG